MANTFGATSTTMSGKVIAITGASSGIGAASALLLAGRGAKVVLGARRTEHLESLATRITQGGGEAAYLPTDVRRREDLVALVEMASARFGRLDVLVSNAGIGPISRLHELRVEDWEKMIDVNLKGFLYGIAAALPVFRKQGFGHFVSIVSTAGLTVSPTMAVYAGTKNAVRTISEGLRQEAGDKLRVTCISPGFVKTDFADSMTNPEIRQKIMATRDQIAISPNAIGDPPDVDVNDMWFRPQAQDYGGGSHE